MKKRTFPHIPKSTKSIELGDLWSIPLDKGEFACGRVVGYSKFEGKQQLTTFLAGLLDWISDKPPTAESIAGSKTLIQGRAHIKTILLTGGCIKGNRLLELDDISPEFFIEYPHNTYASVFRGIEEIRIATPEDIQKFPTLSTFGSLYMREYAKELLQRRPNMPLEPNR